ncbi:MAG TPA: PadR family transcriptional regulator [Allosphingosinicella sp.]|nr:PadR family transcriptional regulator [Allosphingosinicella sp.]
MDIGSWQTQLRKGAAELVVLSLLVNRERYGLELLEHAGGSGGVLSDGTLYPLLTRLEREGKILARWAMADDAKVPRKYYRLSSEGEAMIAEMKRIWNEFSAFVSSATQEGNDGQPVASPSRTLSARA